MFAYSKSDSIFCYCSIADRAKAIKTKAVINESPTEKLIRELREENQRLMEQLKAGGVVYVEAPQGAQPTGTTDEGKKLSGYYMFNSCSCFKIFVEWFCWLHFVY